MFCYLINLGSITALAHSSEPFIRPKAEKSGQFLSGVRAPMRTGWKGQKLLLGPPLKRAVRSEGPNALSAWPRIMNETRQSGFDYGLPGMLQLIRPLLSEETGREGNCVSVAPWHLQCRAGRAGMCLHVRFALGGTPGHFVPNACFLLFCFV